MTLAISCNELRILSHNMEQLLNANLPVREDAASSPERFDRALYKGTLVAEHYFNWLSQS